MLNLWLVFWKVSHCFKENTSFRASTFFCVICGIIFSTCLNSPLPSVHKSGKFSAGRHSRKMQFVAHSCKQVASAAIRIWVTLFIDHVCVLLVVVIFRVCTKHLMHDYIGKKVQVDITASVDCSFITLRWWNLFFNTHRRIIRRYSSWRALHQGLLWHGYFPRDRGPPGLTTRMLKTQPILFMSPLTRTD